MLLIGQNRLCVIVAIAAIILLAIALVATNSTLIFTTVFTIALIIISILAAILTPGIRNEKINVSKGGRLIDGLNIRKCHATYQPQNAGGYRSGDHLNSPNAA